MRVLILLAPYLLAISPILLIWKSNDGQVDLDMVLPILGVILVATGFIHALATALYRDGGKATAGTSVIVFLFFTYGHFFDFLWVQEWFSSMQILNWILGGVFLLAGVLALQLIRRSPVVLPFNRFLVILGFLLSASTILGIVSNSFSSAKNPAAAKTLTSEPMTFGPRPEVLTVDSPEHPDIYYIILDGYAREDLLKEIYQYDNKPFLDALRKRGFYIATESTSNYPMTFLSLASTLNMRYINTDAVAIGRESTDRRLMYDLIRDNTAARFMQSKGYRYVTVNTNWGGTEVSDIADLQLEMCPLWMRSEFTSVIMRTTAARSFVPSVADMHRYAFNAVERVAAEPGPTFTFSHMLVPHNPYVFDADGNERADVPLALQWTEKTGGWGAKDDYIAQLSFTNRRVLAMIDKILATSAVRPLIVLQSDHGSATRIGEKEQDGFVRERHAILNAFLAPEELVTKLYPEITSVNTFRLIFSELFEADFPLIEERNYFAWYKNPYELRDVTEIVTAAPSSPSLHANPSATSATASDLPVDKPAKR